MKLGILLQSNKPEHVWNAFRLGITARKAGHFVAVFLMNEGTELDTIQDTPDFDISTKVTEFKDLGGILSACSSCLKFRGREKCTKCRTATMPDLLKFIEESDKVLVWG